ncbi:MAG: malonate decarboxylase holo-[acyl-carrier-protein] synthase [Pseudomonadota bacterium]
MHSRHELVWLTAHGWQAARAACPQHATTLERWQREDWPCVVRREDAGADPARELCLGIALPPGAKGIKVRIALRIDLANVARRRAPLALADVRTAVPTAWREGFAVLESEAGGLALRVYGSLSWQALTGLPCVTDTSDMDLLIEARDLAQLHAGVALLGAAHGLPLDGEIVFPGGQAVALKEWAGHDERVLVKHGKGVRLARRSALLATLEAPC